MVQPYDPWANFKAPTPYQAPSTPSPTPAPSYSPVQAYQEPTPAPVHQYQIHTPAPQASAPVQAPIIHDPGYNPYSNWGTSGPPTVTPQAASGSINPEAFGNALAQIGQTIKPYQEPTPAPVAAPPVNPAPVLAQAATPAPTSTPATPAQSTIDKDAIRREIEARLAKQRSGLAQAVDYTKTQRKNSFDYTNTLQGDRRTLEDTRFDRNVNPFSGQKGYLESQVVRGRQIDDKASNDAYQNDISAADRRLAEFDALAPEQQDAMYNELLRIERDYGLQVGQLTGTFEGSRTLAGQQFDWGQTVDEAGLTGMYNGMKTAAQSNADRSFGDSVYRDERDFNRGVVESDRNYNIQKTAAQLQQEGARLGNAMSKLQLDAYPQEQRLRIQQLQKQIAEIGKSPYQSESDRRMDQLKIEMATIELDNLKNPSMKDSEISDQINQSPLVKKQYDENQKLIGTTVEEKDKEPLMQYIKSLPGMTADKAKPWFVKYGLWSPN